MLHRLRRCNSQRLACLGTCNLLSILNRTSSTLCAYSGKSSPIFRLRRRWCHRCTRKLVHPCYRSCCGVGIGPRCTPDRNRCSHPTMTREPTFLGECPDHCCPGAANCRPRTPTRCSGRGCRVLAVHERTQKVCPNGRSRRAARERRSTLCKCVQMGAQTVYKSLSGSFRLVA